uniref:Uncharacterized protein n=1 Tax=Stegastes partitus TaxID=144197 RepID=A0A3B5ALG0_9TELE
MADVSLDEVIRQRGINLKAPAKRYSNKSVSVMFWGVKFCFLSNPSFLTLGFQVKDAREKLGQKDARFKIRGRGGAGAGAVQDARQMINSRKQGQNHHTHVPKRMMDARDRLSLKRSIGGGGTQIQTAAAPPLKITKTIQVRVEIYSLVVRSHAYTS